MSYVQGNNHLNGSSTVATAAVTLTGTVGSGNAVFVSLSWSSTAGDTPTCTDDKSNTYTLVDNVRNAALTDSYATFYALNVTNAPQTVTGTFNGGANRSFGSILADEYSGIATSAALDGHTMQSQGTAPGTGTDAVTSGNATTTADGNLIYGTTANVNGAGSIAAGTGYAQRQYNTNNFMTEDKTQTTHGTIAATFTAGNATDPFITGIMAFKVAGGDTLFAQSSM